MANKKEPQRRRSLNDRLDAELAAAESIQVAGITTNQPTTPSAVTNQQEGRGEAPAQPPVVSSTTPSGKTGGLSSSQPGVVQQPTEVTTPLSHREGQVEGLLLTKKATTIMPKEVFNALQMYCTRTDTPKHRALYHFVIDGLYAAGQITDAELQRFRELSPLLTTTYEKK